MARKSRGGPSLLGLLAIVGVLTFTNAGNWMLTQLQGLSANCYGLVPRASGAAGAQACAGLSWAVDKTTVAANWVGQQVAGVRQLKQQLANGVSSLPDAARGRGIGRSVEAAYTELASSADRLEQMMRSGPQHVQAADIQQQFQQAVDSFTISQHYMRTEGGTAQAMRWLQQGAQQPNGFGMVSQLSLGDMYRSGAQGVPQSNARAEAYYRQASASLSQLEASHTPEAQQMLRSLPLSTAELKQKIARAVDELPRQ